MIKEYIKKVSRSLRIPAAIGILLWPVSAMADPASALMLLGTVLTKTAIAWVGYTLIAGTIIYGTVDARRRARHASEDAKRAFNSNLQDRSQTILSSLPPKVIRYGRTVAGSTVVAVFTTDKSGVRQNGDVFTKKDAYKHVVYVHASHECSGVHGYKINGVEVGELDDEGWATNPVFRLSNEYGYSAVRTVELAPGASYYSSAPMRVLKAFNKSVTDYSGGYPDNPLFYSGVLPDSAYTLSGDSYIVTNPSGTATIVLTLVYLNGASTLRISTHLGSSTQTVDTYLNGLIPDKWTANHRLRGRCYSIVTVDLENTDFQGGVPQFEADLDGRLVYDPRSSSTSYSTNWALIVRDWLTQSWGADADVVDIEDASVITSANDSDVGVPVSLLGYADTSLWTFTSSADGFTGINCTISASSGALTATGTSVNTNFAIQKTGLSIAGSSNRYLRVRIRRLAGFTWKGIIQYQTAGHGFSESFYAVVPLGLKIGGGYQEVVWDMHSLTSGSDDWKSNTITAIRIIPGEGTQDSFQFDWVAVSNGATTTVTQPKYTINAAFTTEDSRESILNDLVAAGAGTVYHSGQWVVQAGAWSSPVMVLNDSDLVGQIQIVQADAGLDELFNGVHATYFELGSSTAKDADPYSVAALVAEDGEELWQSLAFPYTDNEQRVQNLCRIAVERVRSGQIIQFPAGMSAFPLRIGDRVYVNNTEYGFDTKTFVVTDWNFGQTSPVVLTLQKDSAAIWDLADQVVYDQTPNTSLSNPRFVLPFLDSSIVIESGTDHLQKESDGSLTTRVYISWPVLSAAYMEGDNARVDIIWQRVMRDEPNTWRRVEFPANQGYGYLLGASSTDIILVGIRPRNSLGFSAEYIYKTHEVIGETQPASDVTGFSATPFAGAVLLQWDACSDIDYFETEIRTGASWVAGTQVFRGNSNKYLFPQAVPANVTFYIKNRDSSGNESTNAISAVAASLSLNDTRNYDFTNGLTGWSGISSVSTGQADCSGGTFGVVATPYPIEVFPEIVPVDPFRRYRVTMRFYISGGSGGPVYAGVRCYDGSGNSIGNPPGYSSPWCVAQNLFLVPGQWYTLSGYIGGPSTQYVPSATVDVSQFWTGTANATPSLLLYTGFTGSVHVDYMTFEDITDAVAVQSDGFSAMRVWDFNGIGLESDVSIANQTASFNGSSAVRLTSSTNDPMLRLTSLSFDGSQYDKIRARIKRVSGTGWDGTVYYVNDMHVESGSYAKTIPEPVAANIGWTVVEWDMSQSSLGGVDWKTGGSIRTIRIDFGGASGDVFDVDWIAIGRSAPSGDLSVVSNAQWVGRNVSVVGDVATKSGTVKVWGDADVYSKEQYYGGAYASASVDALAAGQVMFGLNSDPLTDSNYTSLDYAWYCEGSTGVMRIYESGIDQGIFDSSISSTDVWTVAYDGSQVYYLKNGIVKRSVAASPGLAFFFDSAFESPGMRLLGMRFGPLSSNNWASIGGFAKPSDYASADLTLVNDGNTTQQGNRLVNTSGSSSSWDSGAHSKDGYLGGASASIVIHTSQTTSGYESIFGLNNAPSSVSYGDINFAFYIKGIGGGSGELYAFNEGAHISPGGSPIGTFVNGDLLAITFDGYKARWYKNGSVIFDLVNVDTTSLWYFDCSIVQLGEYLDRISFRPMSMVAGLNTPQISPNAVTANDAEDTTVTTADPATVTGNFTIDCVDSTYSTDGTTSLLVMGEVIVHLNVKGGVIPDHVRIGVTPRSNGVSQVVHSLGPLVPKDVGHSPSWYVVDASFHYSYIATPSSGAKAYDAVVSVSLRDDGGTELTSSSSVYANATHSVVFIELKR